MSSNKLLVSIGMPVYNGEPFLRQSLDCLLAQDYENFELIIADNASTDTTQQVCLKYAASDARIRYYRNAENIGAIANFNRALSLATGEYFAWAAADDMWEPTYIKTTVNLLNRNSSAVLAFSAFNNINEHSEEVRTYPHLFDLPAHNSFNRLRNYIIQDGCLGKANLIYGLMRRNALQLAGGFRLWGGTFWGSDMLVVFRLLSLGDFLLAEDLLFHKRLVVDPSEPLLERPKNPGAARMSTLYSSFYNWHSYFSGYERIIRITEGLSTWEKTKLRAALWREAAQTHLGSVKDIIVWPAARSIVWRSRRFRFGRSGERGI